MSVHQSVAKFLDPPTDDGYRSARYNSSLMSRTGTGGGGSNAALARARSAPSSTSQTIGYDSMDIATRTASDHGGAIDFSLQRRKRFEHGGHVFKTEQSSFAGSRCLEAPVDEAAATRSLNRSANRSQELARQWKVNVHSDDVAIPRLLQGKIRADGCPAARDDTHQRIFVRSKERPYYVNRAQLQYWQDRRGRTHDIIGGHDIEPMFTHPAYESSGALPVYNNDPMGAARPPPTASSSTSRPVTTATMMELGMSTQRLLSSSGSSATIAGRAIAGQSAATASSLASVAGSQPNVNQSAVFSQSRSFSSTQPLSPSQLRAPAGRATFRAITTKPSPLAATTSMSASGSISTNVPSTNIPAVSSAPAAAAAASS